MANEAAVAERANFAQLDLIGTDTNFPRGAAESIGERLVQTASRWVGITTFFAALGGLGVWLLG